jgi:murein DD-endopeptidase MepM/ murein hydrolase activator NlpD
MPSRHRQPLGRRPALSPVRFRALPVVLSCLAAISLASPGAAAAGPAPVKYHPPVEAPIIDRFRAPSTPWGPGNRGIDYATAAGAEVRSAAPGEVTFAGQVGGTLHVVVLDRDGVRTSYSFLSSVGVVQGQLLEAGQVIGTSGTALHFGARVGRDYIDPMLLLAGESGGRVRLVSDMEERPTRQGEERGVLRRLSRSAQAVRPVSARAVAWARLLTRPVR